MNSDWLPLGATERIELLATDGAGAPITGCTTFFVSIRRVSDDTWLDFDDYVFKAAGWVTRLQQMSELDAVNSPGLYYFDFVTATYPADDYRVFASQVPVTTFPEVVTGELRVGGGELPTKAELATAASTDYVTALAGSVLIAGTVIAGTYVSTRVRDAAYWQIQETDAIGAGLAIELLFNLPNATTRPGAFFAFGRYTGLPSATHYLELWAYDYVAAAWELLCENFIPGGAIADTEYSYQIYERHVNRASSNAVTIRLVHHVAVYDATHYLYLDRAEVSAIKIAGSVEIAVVQADTDNLQTRIPAALVGGRIDSSVGAMAANVVTAAAIATNAIDSDAIAASAVTEIQAGLSTSVAVAAVQADTDDIQTRLPATLNGGRMRSHVEAMDTDVIGSAQIAAGAIGVSEAPALANLDVPVSVGPLDLANGVETSLTMRQALRVALAVLAGETGIAGNVVTFRNVGNTKDRVIATMTLSERASVVVDGT